MRNICQAEFLNFKTFPSAESRKIFLVSQNQYSEKQKHWAHFLKPPTWRNNLTSLGKVSPHCNPSDNMKKDVTNST
jgi:hypothetical protein